MTFNIVNNGTLATPWTGSVVSAITINNSAVATQTTLLQGNIVNNVIGNPATIDSGSSQGDCISISSNGNGMTTVKVDNNRLRQYSNLSGIDIALRDGTAGTLNATVTNNIVANPGTFSSNGVFVSSGAAATDAGLVQLDLLNNTLGGSGGNGSTDFRVRHRFASTIRMPGYTGAPTGTAAVVTYFQSRNTGAETGSATVNTTAPVGGQFQNTNPPGSAVPLPPAGPLMAASGGVDAGERPSVLVLTQEELNVLFGAAIERWRATGLSTEQLAAMRRIKFEIADLSGPYLGEADGNLIRVDNDAAGAGWFIDPTPLHDEEFGDVVSPTRIYTDVCSTPAGHLDLLTALMHELGHDIGLPDTYALPTRDDLMYGYLVKGERRLPRRNEARGVNPSGVTKLHFLSLASEERTITAAKNVANQNGQALSVPKATAEGVALIYQSEAPWSYRSTRLGQDLANPNALLSGETVTLNTIATFPAARSITIKYAATVNTPPTTRQVSTQGTVSGGNFSSVLTDDPDVVGANNPTVTLVDTLSTWTGATSTDWNTAGNWTPNTYAPGVSNPAVNDVVISNLGAQPNISATDVTVFSLSLANGRTLTITNKLNEFGGNFEQAEMVKAFIVSSEYRGRFPK